MSPFKNSRIKSKKPSKKPTKGLSRKEALDHLWTFSDDAIGTSRPLSMIYDKVPKHLKDVEVSINEFHIFPKNKKRAILKWLNKK